MLILTPSISIYAGFFISIRSEFHPPKKIQANFHWKIQVPMSVPWRLKEYNF